jgi:hypothetical protein
MSEARQLRVRPGGRGGRPPRIWVSNRVERLAGVIDGYDRRGG